MAQSLYIPQLESDACGIGLIAQLDNKPSHHIVSQTLTILENMEHRGATGSEANTGDGAGIMTQIPDSFFRQMALEKSIQLPAKGYYGIGFYFLPRSKDLSEACLSIIRKESQENGFEILMERNVPTSNTELGSGALSTEPLMVQVFIRYQDPNLCRQPLERQLYLLSKRIHNKVINTYPDLDRTFYDSSFSSQTIVYKGQLKATQLRGYFDDLRDPDFLSAMAMVHSRFSTNTVPEWRLAQPFHTIAHNGEINTIQGNVTKWKGVEPLLVSDYFDSVELKEILPLCHTLYSDSGHFDSVLQFLTMIGYSLPHALMMMIPEAYQNAMDVVPYKKAFYQYHEYMMDPWDGPASICFSNGYLVGATLDRNGLRPSRYTLTKDNVLIISSEAGILPIADDQIVLKRNLSPGQILVADLDKGQIVGDDELKRIICQNRDYGALIDDGVIYLHIQDEFLPTSDKLTSLLGASGFTKEDINGLLGDMVKDGKETISSMGTDIPLAVLSEQPQPIFNYFKQHFAQVTNPPIDPLREQSYMSLQSYIGSGLIPNPMVNQSLEVIHIESPYMSFAEFKALITKDTRTCSIDVNIPANDHAWNKHLDRLRIKVEEAYNQGSNVFIIDNTDIHSDKMMMPSLLAVGIIHQHLLNKGIRKKTSIIVKGADVLEVHHFACLVSFGADAICPYHALLAIGDLARTQNYEVTKASYNYRKAIDQGLLKVMSKIGISTMASYKYGQTFEALGIHSQVIDLCFTGTISRIQGMTFEQLAHEQQIKHDRSFANDVHLHTSGNYAWRKNGEYHLFNPTTIHLLRHSTRTNDYPLFKKYSQEIDAMDAKSCTLRSLLSFNAVNTSIKIEDVEPVTNILKRFATGAMSFGSISHEAHTTLAKAMNTIGGKSNSGEGGEDPARYLTQSDEVSMSSAIKQIASGRFGVTIEYLNNAIELQIKMAQGAKPGEGGQLPGHKVDENIARVRHSTPGVGLISPPPHHDIYSIEDLAQLIFDLKNANPCARISVKLVSKAGVGIIASGVAKAHADHILISGYDGGTGASPLSSIMHAGLPWELGLSETHQTLVKNGLRDRVTLQVDGQIRTGRDMAIATLLGAEEWGIATAALVVSGCILMRKCHLNTCPVGIATQDPSLRSKFDGEVQFLVNYFHFLAEEMREIMAKLGYKTIDQMVGQVQNLTYKHQSKHWKHENLDLSPILYQFANDEKTQKLHKNIDQDHGLEDVLDHKLIKFSGLALHDQVDIERTFAITSVDRAVGTMLSGFLSRQYGSNKLREKSIKLKFVGTAGQSFGAFSIKGLELRLIGQANDYFGKGLSGGTVAVAIQQNTRFKASENHIIGNVALYGATSGYAYIGGKAGERFAVRNSGAVSVVEGVGDNACEYMTGGTVLILGNIGRNFAAGMSGGIAYLYKCDQPNNINKEMVEVESLSKSDFIQIRELITQHFEYTSSAIAKNILDHFDIEQANFTKIIPFEYKKALQTKANGKVSNVHKKITY